MPTLTTLVVPLPADTHGVRAADVDGDGRDELIIESRRAGKPDAVRLTVVAFAATGAVTSRREVDLGSRPMLWDAGHGLWGVDREGLVRFDAGGTVRIARFPTVLAALGPSTPAWAPIAHDLDGDAIPELLAWSAGRYLAFRADGTPMGSIPAPAEGALAVDWTTGAASTHATLTPPPLAVADLDGDGRKDLVLPAGARIAAYYTGATVGTRAGTLPLPIDLDPPEGAPGETRRDVHAVWLEDIDGDGRMDLGVQRTVRGGSWFGATAELSWAKGRGDGFEALRTIPVAAAAFGVELRDLDGDGDRDYLAPIVDVGLASLARALVARSVTVNLSVLRLDGAAPPLTLRTLAFPLENPDRLQVDLSADVDGDGFLDLVTNDGEDRVRVYRGRVGGLDGAPAWDEALRVPLGDDTIFVHDLTGDGRAEVVVWGPREASATVLRLPR